MHKIGEFFMVGLTVLASGCAYHWNSEVQTVTPKLGPKFGIIMRAEGMIFSDPERKDGEHFCVSILNVDGRRLSSPVIMEVRDDSYGQELQLSKIPTGKVIIFYGYETVIAGGLPADSHHYLEYPMVQSCGYGIVNFFQLRRVEDINGK